MIPRGHRSIIILLCNCLPLEAKHSQSSVLELAVVAHWWAHAARQLSWLLEFLHFNLVSRSSLDFPLLTSCERLSRRWEWCNLDDRAMPVHTRGRTVRGRRQARAQIPQLLLAKDFIWPSYHDSIVKKLVTISKLATLSSNSTIDMQSTNGKKQ